MDLQKKAQQALAGMPSGAGRRTLRVQEGNQTLTCELTVEIVQLDSLAVQFTDITLATDTLAGKSTDELKALADQLSKRLTYLLEPISPIETDPSGATVQLRSNPPQKDEDGTRSLGKNTFLYKLQSLMVGGFLAAVAGMLLAIEQQSVHPDAFLPRVTFFLYVIVIMGGAGTIIGPIVGAIVFQYLYFFFDGFMSEAQEAGWFGDALDATDAQQVKLVLVGLGLMALMIFRPQGMFGKRTEQLIGEQ